MPTDDDAYRIFERAPLNLNHPTLCLEWTGSVNKTTGYGKTRLDGRLIDAHRAAWIVTHGPIPEGMLVCHKCDNRRCIAPAHLFLGTHRDNMLDAHAKGRLNIQAMVDARKPKLTGEAVRDIYARAHAGEPRASIAREYHIVPTAVSHIKAKRGKRYAALLEGVPA
jgi:hypothetical protein